MANNRMSVLPAPPGPAPPTSEGVFVDRSWSARWMPTRPVCARPLILDGKVRAQSRKAGGQAAWPQLTPTGGLLRGGPQRPKLPGSPTFDDVCVFQRQLPQQLVFAGRVDDAGCRVPVGATGCSGQGRGAGPGRDNCSHFPSRPHPAPPSHSQAHGAAPQGARLPLQGGADDEVREQKEGPVLLAADCLLWGPRQDSGRGPPFCPQCPGDSQAQGGVRTLPQLPRGGGRGRVGTRPGDPVGAEEQGQPWAAGTSRRVNEAGWERGQARGQQDFSPLQ